MEKRFVFLVLAVMVAGAILITGCTSSEAPSETVAGQTFKVGIDAEYPPYAYLDKDGNAVGFDVDSMKWIAEQQGFDVTFHPTAWDGIIPALQAGKIDIIYSGMTITEERAEKVNFTIPYWKVDQSVAIHTDTDYTMEDFKAGDLVVGGQRGTTGVYWVEENLIETGKMPEANLKLYDNFPLATQDLENKRVDAIIYDRPPMEDAIADKPLVIIGDIDTGEEYGAAVRKSDVTLLNALNEGIADLMNDPYWEELKDKYDM